MDQLTIFLLVLLVGTLIIGIGVIFFIAQFSRMNVPFKKAKLLSNAEWLYYFALLHTLPSRYAIFPQVRLAALANILDSAFLWKRFSALGSKSVDYVIWDKVTKEVILVIELDDKTHLRKDRKARDAYVDQVLKRINVPIYHQVCKSTYDNEDIKSGILAAIDQLQQH